MTLELLCKRLGVEMGKFEPDPHLKEMKAEIDISYPRDVLAMIAERKVAVRAGASSSGVHAEPGSAMPEPALHLAHLFSSETEVSSSALGN